MKQILQIPNNILRRLRQSFNELLDNRAVDSVPIISIDDKITSDTALSVQERLEKLPRKISAIGVLVNSSKGSPAQTHIIVTKLQLEAQKRKVPLYTFGQDMCVSTGLLLLSAGDKAYVDETTIVGGADFGASRLTLPRDYVERNVFKDEGLGITQTDTHPFSDVSQEKKKDIEEASEAISKQVRQHIVKYRKGKVASEGVGDEYLTGKKAVEKGYADGLGTFSQILQKDFPKAKVCHIYSSKKTIWQQKVKKMFSMRMQSL